MHLIVANLALSRGGRTLLEGLSFRAAGGEAVVLTGPNGVGKTTLIRAIAGLLRPDAGEVRLEDAGDPEATVAEQCHFVGHLNGIKPGLTVAENALFWADYLGGSRAGVASALDRMGLSAISHVPGGYLSAGQKRRLGIARLLLARRPVWLLDEPTVSLDEASRNVVAALVDAHLAEGGLAVIATHLPLGLARMTELVLGGRRAAA